MSDSFFDHPILNSPYDYPARHWELDANGQPTERIIEHRRRAEFITPIPKPKKRKASATQQEMVFDEGKGRCFLHRLLLGRQTHSPTRETDQPSRFKEREYDILRCHKQQP